MSTRLFVSNVHYQADAVQLRELFVEGGYLPLNVKIKREAGKSRGFAFVELADAEVAEKAIEDMDGQELMGRRINVVKAQPPRYGKTRGMGA